MPKGEPTKLRRKDPDTGQWIYGCPEGCKKDSESEEPLEFDNLYKLKAHIQKEHGGQEVSVDDVEQSATSFRQNGDAEDGASATTSSKPVASSAGTASPKPKKVSPKTRELNNKMNRAVRLTVLHLMRGISEEQRAELDNLRGELMEAVMGFDLDFEQKLFNVSGKWALILFLFFIYTMPMLPTGPQMWKQMKERVEAQGND